jgi:hypothetical protein
VIRQFCSWAAIGQQLGSDRAVGCTWAASDQSLNRMSDCSTLGRKRGSNRVAGWVAITYEVGQQLGNRTGSGGLPVPFHRPLKVPCSCRERAFSLSLEVLFKHSLTPSNQRGRAACVVEQPAWSSSLRGRAACVVEQPAWSSSLRELCIPSVHPINASMDECILSMQPSMRRCILLMHPINTFMDECIPSVHPINESMHPINASPTSGLATSDLLPYQVLRAVRIATSDLVSCQ